MPRISPFDCLWISEDGNQEERAEQIAALEMQIRQVNTRRCLPLPLVLATNEMKQQMKSTAITLRNAVQRFVSTANALIVFSIARNRSKVL